MNQKYNTEKLIELFSAKHNGFYNYDKTCYVGYKKKVTVTCPEHGDFDIAIQKHLEGQGCPKCRYIKSANTKRRSIKDIIENFKKVHGNEYDYSLIQEYKNTKSKLPIICKKHGVFYQSYDNHVKGQGCPECGKIKCGEHQRLTTDDFISNAKLVHGDKYDYSESVYTLGGNKIDIICPTHGKYRQIARNHLFGAGCPLCFKEKSNVETDILNYIHRILPDTVILENDRTVLEGKEIDIYIPSLNIGIEVNGLIWHSEKFNDDKNYHLNKTIECLNKGIRLIHIFEDDWIYKQHIVKSRISNILGKTENIIYARKCDIKEISYYDSEMFLNQNHIQGNCVSKFRYGLYYNNELVSVMTFSKSRKNVHRSQNCNEYELLRFCNKINTTVIGGASKLFKKFVKDNKPVCVISYADKCWSIGNLYEQLGFKKYNESKPSYSYVIGKKRVNRYNLRKDVLISKYKCPENMTEHEFCLSNDWYRIYDCGCICYEKKFVY